MVGQLAAAQLALEAAIAELSRSGADSTLVAASRTQLASVSDLLRQVGTAGLTRLAELRGEVVATAASATALATQATGTAGNNSAATNANLTPAQRARATIESVGRDLFDKHVLDEHLQFASAEDEAAYRKREEARRRAYEAELEKHTIEGDRRATAIVQSQLADAKAHGADRSPEFGSLSADADSASAALQPPSPTTPAANLGQIERAKPAKPAAATEAGDDLTGIAAALKVTGISIENAPSEPNHGVPARSRVAAVAQSAAKA